LRRLHSLVPLDGFIEAGEGLFVGHDEGGDEDEVGLGGAFGAGVEGVFDFFFEGDEPGGDVEADAGGLAGEGFGVVLEDFELGRVAAEAGFFDGRGDEGADAVDRQRANEAFGQAIGITQRFATTAANTIVRVMTDSASPPNARIAAANALLRLGRQGIELDDLAVRVDALEQSTKNDQKGEQSWRSRNV